MKKNNNNFDPMWYKLIVERASRCISDDEIERIVGQYNAFVDSQRDDVKFAVHTSPDGEPMIMSKKQFGDWVLGYTGDYLRVYPYKNINIRDVISKGTESIYCYDENVTTTSTIEHFNFVD